MDLSEAIKENNNTLSLVYNSLEDGTLKELVFNQIQINHIHLSNIEPEMKIYKTPKSA